MGKLADLSSVNCSAEIYCRVKMISQRLQFIAFLTAKIKTYFENRGRMFESRQDINM